MSLSLGNLVEKITQPFHREQIQETLEGKAPGKLSKALQLIEVRKIHQVDFAPSVTLQVTVEHQPTHTIYEKPGHYAISVQVLFSADKPENGVAYHRFILVTPDDMRDGGYSEDIQPEHTSILDQVTLDVITETIEQNE
jgi:hypothetical protein